MNRTKQTIEILIESERIADKILQNKQEILALSMRKEENREAINNLKITSDKKVWITIGSILVKMKKDKALELLNSGKLI